MATSTPVRVPTDDAAALIGLALREKGINISEQFWMTPSEPHWRVLGLVSPDRDAPDGYTLYGKIVAALEGFPYADRSFIGGRMMVFGENKFRKEIEMIHAGFTKISEMGPYEDVEVVPIPLASEIRKSGEFDFIPEGTDGSYTVVFCGFPGSKGCPFRKLQGESELIDVFRALDLPLTKQQRILQALGQGQPYHERVYDIGLDTLYRLKLV